SRGKDGHLMAIFPLPAGYEAVGLRVLKMGLRIWVGLRGKYSESIEKEFSRIRPFEDLISRLDESDWPLLVYSLDLQNLRDKFPDLNISEILERLTIPLWESNVDKERAPFFYPNYFAVGDSTWFPQIFGSLFNWREKATKNLEPFFLSVVRTDRSLALESRLVHVPLEKINPNSKFGRITLLRFFFFESLLNGKAKVEYLDFLQENSTQQYESLLELMEFLAIPLEREYLLSFCSNYRAKKFREAFQIIDGRSE
ncbi:MAG: hypothetical protein KDD35_05770, partial [Bdellovibrionales bacterium]|nr:hypothetical protein [Bdellovibrionales bacterium]